MWPRSLQHWLDQLRIDPDNEFIGTLLSKLQLVHSKELKELSALGAGYAGLFLIEGIGLWREVSWAAYLTVISTSLLLPFELYEVLQKVTALRISVLLLNLVIVLYLFTQLKRHTLRSRTVVGVKVLRAEHE